MGLLSFTPSRTVLLLSDEALFIYKASGSSVSLVASVPWASHEFASDVAKILKGECSGRPVILLNDMVEQHYRKERVIKKGIGLMDRAGMVKRKLAFSFPNYPIRASLPLKKVKGSMKGKGGAAASDAFIFAAVPTSEQFEQTMEAVGIALVSVAGFCLLPVESAGMVSRMAAKLEGKGKEKSRWSIFVGQNRGGGLRQIVTKDGQIAMTRITPVSSAEDDPNQWANEVFQEFAATMSYVTRFGYQPEDGLKVIVIADGPASVAVEPLFQEQYDVNVLNTKEAADILKLSLGNQDRKSFSTSLHIAWVARKSKFTLPMDAQSISDVSRPRKIAGIASVALVLLALGLIYFLMVTALNLSQASSEVEDGRARLVRLQGEHKVEIDKKEALGIDIKLVQSSIKIHEELDREKVDVLSLIGTIGRTLGPDMRVDQIVIEEIDSVSLDQMRRSVQSNQLPLVFQAKMQITYPSDVDPDIGNREVEQLINRLSGALPGHVVGLTKKINDFEYVEEITVESGVLEEEEEQDLIAEIVIKGPAS